MPISSMLISKIAMPTTGLTLDCRMRIAATGNRARYSRTKHVRHVFRFCRVSFIISEPTVIMFAVKYWICDTGKYE